jgi:hypothetical protein
MMGEEEQRQHPMTPGELVAEFKELARYGAKQARKVGIDVLESFQTLSRKTRRTTTSSPVLLLAK